MTLPIGCQLFSGKEIQDAINAGIAGGADPTFTGLTTVEELTASSTVTLSPVDENVVISPSGSGVVTMAPATAGTLNNVSIGVTTPLAGKFTTLAATDAVALSPASKDVVISPSGTGKVTMAPVGASTIDNVAIGGSTPLAGKFTTVTSASVTTTGYAAQSVGNALTAVGTDRATSLALTKQVNNVTTAGSGTGVTLPTVAAAGIGAILVLNNAGANAIQVYGAGSDTIDGAAAATGVPLTNTKRSLYIAVAAATWISAQLGVVSA